MKHPDDTEGPASASILRTALCDRDWAGLRRAGRRVTFARGDTIITRGTPGDTLYVIEEGRVEISVTLAHGNKAVLNQMGPGETLGEIAFLDGGLRSADATASSSEVVLSEIGRGLDRASDVALELIRELCARVRNASDMFEVKSEKNAEVRLARTLMRLAVKWGRPGAGGTIMEGFSQSELGDLAGLARENVNRQLKLWEEAFVIERRGRTIVLCDADAIVAAARL